MSVCLRKHRTVGSPDTVRPGALIVEAMMAIALFGMFATAAFLPLLAGQESSQVGSDRVRGVYYAEQGLEVARSIRDTDFASLPLGQNGYTIDDSGQWEISGNSLFHFDFESSFNVSSVASDLNRKVVHARTKWKQGYQRSGTTLLSMELTNWRSPAVNMGNWASPSIVSTVLHPGVGVTMRLTNIALSGRSEGTGTGNYLFIANEGAAGASLYVYNAMNVPPVPVAAGFDAGDVSYDVAVYRERLYVLTSTTNAEVRIYDISNPASLTTSAGANGLQATVNVPDSGTALGRTIAVRDSRLYVGTTNGFVYIYDLGTGGTPTQIGSPINVVSAVNDLYVRGDYLYIANSGTNELAVYNISDASSPQSTGAYNFYTDAASTFVQRGTGHFLAYQNTQVYGKTAGSGGKLSTSQLAYTTGLTSFTKELDADPLGCYVLLMQKDILPSYLEIFKGRNYVGATARLAQITFPQGRGGGVTYDPVYDRAYATTGSGLYVIRPAAAPVPQTCL